MSGLRSAPAGAVDAFSGADHPLASPGQATALASADLGGHGWMRRPRLNAYELGRQASPLDSLAARWRLARADASRQITALTVGEVQACDLLQHWLNPLVGRRGTTSDDPRAAGGDIVVARAKTRYRSAGHMGRGAGAVGWKANQVRLTWWCMNFRRCT
ncbi:MAG: hypothetical protein IPO15_17695 [Anaerolineae bacterium]|uniref:hypothetical protein n=1 Tax=Candidatus Amarolinea dominans TaxID=3140696 RepID=UPI00313659D4|nr:hypothetical protein [Anaerolineae bacterium]